MGYLKLFVLVCVIFSSRTNGLPEERVVNGTPAVAGQFPFMVFLRFVVINSPLPIRQAQSVEVSSCSSSLIKPNIVLTAAHCFYNQTVFYPSTNYTVLYKYGINVVGDKNEIEKALLKTVFNLLKNYTVYPSYNLTDIMRNQNDIAMITLPVSVKSPNSIIPLWKFPVEAGAQVVAIGYGLTKVAMLSTAMLRYGNLTIQKSETCYNPDNPMIFTSKYIICAAGTFQSVCSGDSGGALVIYRNGVPVQIGVNVFVINDSSPICTYSRFPQGFVSVAKYYDWINAYANITNQAPSVYSITLLIVFTTVIQISM